MTTVLDADKPNKWECWVDGCEQRIVAGFRATAKFREELPMVVGVCAEHKPLFDAVTRRVGVSGRWEHGEGKA